MANDNFNECPVTYTLDIINSRWRIFIINALLHDKQRNSELLKLLPNISQKVLTENLRFLEEKKIIRRVVYPVMPPKVEYELTELGESIRPLINQIYEWGTKYKSETQPEQ
ncbi:winged helix-turn-helix transcriptional regulator [Eupransor demetentiae]|uniref:HxlR family (HxlR) n=1 Tax=Eupransor demetentiae TaxID=3109584 RepID=A0ABM9N595_9LACO|nr:DNA-binding transcriptional regulator [Lactobacillaceae bacterium LMG 33000]